MRQRSFDKRNKVSLANPYSGETRSHPFEGLIRENIIISDIKVTPLPYVHDGNDLWRIGGLLVWKSDAALVQMFTNQGMGEESPYRGPDKLLEIYR